MEDHPTQNVYVPHSPKTSTKLLTRLNSQVLKFQEGKKVEQQIQTEVTPHNLVPEIGGIILSKLSSNLFYIMKHLAYKGFNFEWR